MKRVYKEPEKPKKEKTKKTERVWVPANRTSSGVRFGYWEEREVGGDEPDRPGR